jgi:hypothetical protein
LRCTVDEKALTIGFICLISVFETMKRIPIPSSSSIIIDDFCRRLRLAVTYAGLPAPILRLQERISFITDAAILFNPFIPFHHRLTGYKHFSKAGTSESLRCM